MDEHRDPADDLPVVPCTTPEADAGHTPEDAPRGDDDAGGDPPGERTDDASQKRSPYWVSPYWVSPYEQTQLTGPFDRLGRFVEFTHYTWWGPYVASPDQWLKRAGDPDGDSGSDQHGGAAVPDSQ